MTIIYLLFFVTTLSLIGIWLYTDKDLAFNPNLEDITNSISHSKFSDMELKTQNNFISDIMGFLPLIGTSRKKQTKRTETEQELKKCKQQLNRNLKTLTYISIMEVKAEIKNNAEKLSNLLNLKSSVQHEIIRLTEKINEYKSLINS